MFCTYDPITRAQLASYLVRALDLPASDQDFFTDDNSNAREADINRAAAAGLFKGCTATRFCPSDASGTRGDGDDPRPRHGRAADRQRLLHR